MNLNDLTPNEGSKKRKRRVARGIGSGLGKTAGRGTKGQKARRQIPAWFEGGQTPIHRRLPIKNGFRNINHKEYAIVNLDDLEKWFSSGDTVEPSDVVAKSIVSELQDGLKILAFGSLSKKLTVHAHKFSKTAIAAIEKAGGKAVVIESAKSEK
jgi:large subunit ribosomal protein L15